MRAHRFRSIALMAALALIVAAWPAAAGEYFTLKASGAQTGAAQGTATQIGNWRQLSVIVKVTAGSGTVNPFRVWVEATWDDGTTWIELPCEMALKTGATAPGTAAAAARDIVNETAVVTSATYIGLCRTLSTKVRAAWNIAGSTPSETFSVSAYAY